MELYEELRAEIETRYHLQAQHPWKTSPRNMTFQERITGKWFALILYVRIKSLGLSQEGYGYVLNVKADPELVHFLAFTPGYLPAYHMNKKNWITILLDGSVPLEQLLLRVEESYQMVTDSPTVRIYEAVKGIPRGKVATYGQVAELAGDRKMARAVGNALHKNPDPNGIPCYRVVNAKGELAGEFAFGGPGAQAALLARDGIEVKDGRVDLQKYGM